MPIVHETVETDLNQEAAFDYVANFETIEEWDPGVVSSRKLTDGPLAVGSEYEVVVQYGGGPQTIVYTVTEVERPRVVVLEGSNDRTQAVDRITFSATETGAVVDYEADIRLKGVFKLATPFLGKLFDQIGEGARAGLELRLSELSASAEAD